MKHNFRIVIFHIPYSQHYNPRLVYILPEFWSIFLCLKKNQKILSQCMISIQERVTCTVIRNPLWFFNITYYCLVLLCDQNSFGRSKMVLVWPNWFGLDHNDLVTTKMKWSRPKWIGLVQIVIFYQNESHLDLNHSFWS